MSYTIKGKSSAFLFFKEYCCRENKRQNKTDYKDIRFAVKCSEMWNAMTEEKKRKFRMMVECDKKRFIVNNFLRTATILEDLVRSGGGSKHFQQIG